MGRESAGKGEGNSPLSDREYDILRNWYTEWAKVCTLLATFSFGAIGYTVIAFRAGAETGAALFQLELLKSSWMVLGLAGALSGLSVGVAFTWFDVISRRTAPSLHVKGVLRKSEWLQARWLGTVGWVGTLSAGLLTVGGLVLVVLSALRAR